MIGFSTEQQSTNFIPAIKLEVTQFLSIETEKASKEGWSKGLEKVLKSKYGKDFPFERLPLGQQENSHIDVPEHDIVRIARFIFDQTIQFKVIYFNVGGGQKLHSIALWECFRLRKEVKRINDQVVYANQESKMIDKYKFLGNSISSLNSIPLSMPDITLDDILTLYGNTLEVYKAYKSYQVLFKKGEILVSRHKKTIEDTSVDKVVIPQLKQDLIYQSGLREYGFVAMHNYKFDDKKLPLESVLKDVSLKKAIHLATNKYFADDIIDTYIKDLSLFNLLSGKVSQQKNQNTYARYFEEVLIGYILTWLEGWLKESGTISVNEVYANIKLKRAGMSGEDRAEYDILLITDDCRLIVLDAKTSSGKNDKETLPFPKDIDSRLQVLKKLAGNYVEYIAVIPFFEQDIKESKNNNNSWWVKNVSLRELPKTLTDLGIKFYAIMAPSTNLFYISQNGIEVKKKGDANCIEIRSLALLLRDIKLSKNTYIYRSKM